MDENVVFLIVFGVLLWLFILLPREGRTKRVGTAVVLIALLFEIFIANFHSFHLIGGKYEKTEVDLQAKNVSLRACDLGTLTSNNEGKEVFVEIRDINRPVGTVKIECSMPYDTDKSMGTPSVYVSVDAADDSHSAYCRIGVADGELIRGDSRSSTLVLDLTGNVRDMNIRLRAEEGQTFTLKSITFNQPVEFHFSLLRGLLLVFVLMALYALITFPSMREPLENHRALFAGITLGGTAVLIAAACVLVFLYQYDNDRAFFSNFVTEQGNQITRELVDAFKARQVWLTDPVPKELLELENPYDWSQRLDEQVLYKWDHLLYDGKYYSYYGIAPVLLLFLPYHLITGWYFPTPEAVLLFGALGILFLSLLYMEFAKRFCQKLPLNMLIAGLIIVQLSSGVWYTFASPLFYEIAQNSGFCFVCAGFFFLLRSRVVGEGNIRYPSLVLSSLCLSLAVLCRPTLALYCVVALAFIAFGLLKLRNHLTLATEKTIASRVWTYVRYLSCALILYAVFGGIQMAYNYARFGSVLDFGIQYSLTINDFTRAQYHTDFVLIGLFNYLLAFPQIHPNFPYVFSNYSDLSTNGYYFLATNSAVGLFWKALPTFGYLGIGSAWKTLSKTERRQLLFIGIPMCILAPLVIICSIWESGYCARYATDFAWQIMLGGMGVLYLLYRRVANEQSRKLMEKFFVFSAVIAVVINVALIYDFMSRDGYLAARFLKIERLFDFWK